jgi:hypothetical protein
MTPKFDVFNNNSDKIFYLSLHKNYSNKNKLVSNKSVRLKFFYEYFSWNPRFNEYFFINSVFKMFLQ